MRQSIDKALRFFSIVALVAMLFVSCGDDKKSDNASVSDTAAVTDATEKGNTSVKEVSSDIKKKMEDAKEASSNTWSESNAYDLTQVDVPPLFDASCVGAKNARKCSDEKLIAFISENVKKPRGWNKSSLEQVLVIIEKDGTVRGVKYVASGNNEGCPECQQAAIDVIGKIKQWTPAMKDGKPVAAKMSIPVRFG